MRAGKKLVAQAALLRFVKKRNRGVAIAVVVVFAGLGLVLISSSRAALFATTIEAESGNLSGNHSAGLTEGASDNKSVRFGAVVAPPTPTPPSPMPSPGGVRGELKVSADGRFLTYQDGQPFFWMGDTAWSIFGRLSREDITYYLQTRKEQGFSVIQMVTMFPVYSQTNFYGVKAINGNVGSINAGYFEHVDYAINEATRLGLYVALWPLWSKDQHGLVSSGNAESYGRFLGNRYKDKPVIWVFGGDDADRRSDVWRPMAKGIAIGKTGSEDYSKMLMTYHPAGQQTSSSTFHNDSWLDFNMVQSGHSSVQRKPYELIEPDYAKTPTKPVVDSEAMYEKHSDGWTNPNDIASSQLVRNYMYWPVFAGAFGHSYGHWYIWPFVDAGHIHPYSGIAKLRGDWKRDYVKDEVAGQVKNLRKLMESRPYQSGVPDQSVITSGAGSGRDRKQATRAANGAYLMIYTPQGGSFSANLNKLSGTAIKAYWYDPRTGNATEVANTQKGAAVQFSPPSAGDWVLVVDDASKSFARPGL